TRFSRDWSSDVCSSDLKLENEPDVFARYAFRYDAVEHLKAVRKLVRRSNRIVRTGSECLNVACKGKYEAIVDGPEIDGDLVCSEIGRASGRERALGGAV